MTIEQFIMLALASFRLSRMIAREHGPANVFGRIKARAGAEFDRGRWIAEPGSLADLLSCDPCLSVFIATIGAVHILACNHVPSMAASAWVWFPFAISGLSLIFRAHEMR